ncbi:hypothetical protein [Humibacter sp.]
MPYGWRVRLVERWQSLPSWVQDGLGAVAFAGVSLVPAPQQYG